MKSGKGQKAAAAPKNRQNSTRSAIVKHSQEYCYEEDRAFMRIRSFAKKWLGGVFGVNSKPLETFESVVFSSAQDIQYPGDKAPLADHVRFMLACRNFIKNHSVPADRQGLLNQYSHAGKPLIGDDRNRPAITNCSYEYFGRKLISIGVPLFIEQAPWVKNDRFNPAFNAGTLWDSFEKLLKSRIGDLGNGDTKYGYYLPTNHYYIEKPVPDSVFDKAQTVIDFYTRTDIEDPHAFLKALQEKMATPQQTFGNARPPFTL